MIDFKPLEKTPSKAFSKSHYFCDYIELLALCDCDDGISESDIYDRFYDDNRIQDIGSEDGSESNETWNSRIQLWFSEITARGFFYGDRYPFILDNGRLKKRDELSDPQLSYLGLLLCSSISYIRNYHQITSTFELLCSQAMSNYLPSSASVHIFGVSSLNNNRYTGSLEDKIDLLIDDLELTKSNRSNIFRDGDNGDGGVDIVAWVPFYSDPRLNYSQMFVCQCAAGNNWNNKQASVERISNYIIDLPSNTQNVLFVPYDFRDGDRYFSEPGEITASIVFDRHRILNLLDSDEIFSGECGENFRNIINYAVEFEEDII